MDIDFDDYIKRLEEWKQRLKERAEQPEADEEGDE